MQHWNYIRLMKVSLGNLCSFYCYLQIAGCSLDLANLLVSLLPVVVRVPLQDYDPLYGIEIKV